MLIKRWTKSFLPMTMTSRWININMALICLTRVVMRLNIKGQCAPRPTSIRLTLIGRFLWVPKTGGVYWKKRDFLTLTLGNTLDERRTKLLASIREKSKGGYAILEIKNGRGALLQAYKLSHLFLMNYFQRVKIGKSNKHMMASEQCRQCKKFHRIEKYQQCSDTLAENPKANIYWKVILKPTESQCRA